MPFITDIQITPLLFPLARPFSNHVRLIQHIHRINIRFNPSLKNFNSIMGKSIASRCVPTGVTKITTIVSGGQTGVDLAAVDVAIKRGIQYGGWCPKERINEAGQIHAQYNHFKEVEGVFSDDAENYAARTVHNIIDSDGTLIIVPSWPLPEAIKDGTLLTIDTVKTHKKPCLVIDLSKTSPDTFQKIDRWINENEIRILNVAGPRETSSPGIYELSRQLLDDVMSYIDLH